MSPKNIYIAVLSESDLHCRMTNYAYAGYVIPMDQLVTMAERRGKELPPLWCHLFVDEIEKAFNAYPHNPKMVYKKEFIDYKVLTLLRELPGDEPKCGVLLVRVREKIPLEVGKEQCFVEGAEDLKVKSAVEVCTGLELGPFKYYSQGSI